MPRIGVVCCVDGEHMPDSGALDCAAEGYCHYPYEVVKAMLDDTGRETAGISATMLDGCRRSTRLKIEEDYYQSLATMYPGFRGTITHTVFENHPEPGYFYERRFEAYVPGTTQTITGKPDKVGIIQRRLFDFKSKSEGKLPSEPDEKHIRQLSVYRWLLYHGSPQEPFRMRANGVVREFVPGTPARIEIEEAFLTYLSMAQLRTYKAPLLPYSEVERWLVEGVRELRDEALPVVPDGYSPYGPNKLCLDWCPLRKACQERMERGE
jgi:hypothetical protein